MDNLIKFNTADFPEVVNGKIIAKDSETYLIQTGIINGHERARIINGNKLSFEHFVAGIVRFCPYYETIELPDVDTKAIIDKIEFVDPMRMGEA